MIALSGAAGVALEPRLLRLSRAWAESPGDSDDELSAEMVHMARLLYPLESLADDVYRRALEGALAATTAGAALAATLDEAAAALDERAGGDWMQLSAEKQVEVMRALENEEYFSAIQATVRYGVFMSAEFWALVGYPGPSAPFGGYLHRGAGEIDWLPENPS